MKLEGRLSKEEYRRRFIRLYAEWERTRHLELVPMLCHSLDRLVRLEPQFDLRNQFKMAF